MGLMDKAKQALKGRSDVVEKGIDRAVVEANKRTKGKYGDKLSSTADTLKQHARKLDEDRAGSGPTSGDDRTGPAAPFGDVDPPAGSGRPPL